MGGKSSDVGFGTTRQTTPARAGAGLQEAAPSEAPRISLPAVMIPPLDAEYFTLQDEVDTAVIQEVVFSGARATFKIPDGHDAAINTVQFFASNADATLAGFTFTLLVAGGVRQGFSGLTIPQLGGAQGINVSPAYLRVSQAQLIAASFNNALGGPHHVGMFVQGWYWPTRKGV